MGVLMCFGQRCSRRCVRFLHPNRWRNGKNVFRNTDAIGMGLLTMMVRRGIFAMAIHHVINLMDHVRGMVDVRRLMGSVHDHLMANGLHRLLNNFPDRL